MFAIARTRAPRAALRQVRNARFASSDSKPSSDFTQALIGGLTGGLVTFAGGYAYYHFSGAKTMVNTAHQTKAYFEDAAKRFQDSTVKPSDALSSLRSTANSYAAFIPGASGVIDTAFNDLDVVRKNHGDEVDKIVKDTYDELKNLPQQGLNAQTAGKAWEIMQGFVSQIGELAGNSASEILNNHPEIKKQIGGSLDQLQSVGEKYGPEAKKQIDQTWDQIRDVMKSGVSADTVNKIRKIVQEKAELVRKLRDQAWDKGMEQAKGSLDKNPKLKELVEKNADALKQGNITELYSKVKQAVESGDTGDIEKYVNGAVEKAKQAGGSGLDSLFDMIPDQYLQMIPGGKDIIPQLSKLKDIAETRGKDAEKIVQETIDEIKKVLSKKSEQAKKLAEKAKEESK